MKPASEHPAHLDDEYGMPCAEALLAGTLALMTGHAQACCADQRELMAARTAASLFTLSQHPRMSPGFREMVQKLHQQWATASGRADSSFLQQSRALWHTTHEVIQ